MSKNDEFKSKEPINDDENDESLEEMEDDEVVDESEVCKYFDFGFLGSIKRKSGVYEKIVLVNRWAWMTDNKYRKIYLPVMDILKEKGFKEKELALVEVKMEKEEIVDYLTSLNMRYNKLLENNAIPYFKNPKI